MNQFTGKFLSWELKDGVVEVALHREPCNEIGALTLEELEMGSALGLICANCIVAPNRWKPRWRWKACATSWNAFTG